MSHVFFLGLSSVILRWAAVEMDAPFLLELYTEGIRLAYRLNGSWTVLGDASIHSRMLDQELRKLTRAAQRVHSGPLWTDVLLPRSHVRYEVTSWHGDEQRRRANIARMLSDLTMPEGGRLAYDWARDEERLHLAIVEELTLHEAKQFVIRHGFTPRTFSARPRTYEFPRAPVFLIR